MTFVLIALTCSLTGKDCRPMAVANNIPSMMACLHQGIMIGPEMLKEGRRVKGVKCVPANRVDFYLGKDKA